MPVAHTGSCGSSVGRRCRCGGCAGSLHGWPGGLALAQPEYSAQRAKNRASSDRAWREANGERCSLRPTIRKARAAVDGAEDDLVKWLAGETVSPPNSASALSQQIIKQAGNLVANEVASAIVRELRADNDADRRIELADSHFFCDLLAATACAMQKFREEFDSAVEYIVTEILTSQMARDSAVVPKPVIELAAKITTQGVDKIIDQLPVGRHFNDALRAVQALAIMTCPAPERHAEVVRCCLKPLGTPIISQEVQDRLKAAMPAWMP
jgi:hypothetical protein